jgi:hypothetical protein
MNTQANRQITQGAKAHAVADRGDDLYETPACATWALIKAEELPLDIWEPCAGRGAIARELREAGHFVIAEDLVAYPGADEDVKPGQNLFFASRAPCQTIVTNPPYKLADKIIRHGLKLDCTVIVLQRLMAIEGRNRSDLIDRHLVRVWAGIERLPMMHREGWNGSKIKASGSPHAWFVFSPIVNRTGQPIELRRISWRD